MKKIITLLFVATFLFTACEGPEGPQGPPGTNIVGETFEYTTSFSAQADFFEASFNPPLVEGDAMLVYRLEDVVNGADVWEPLPTVTIVNNDTGDTLQYRFNYTLNDVQIIAECSNFAAFGPELLQNQTFRAVIVPSDLINGIDTSNIHEVMEAANIKSIQKLN
ncbi:hypothetical protein HX109_00215 [Galbibacter sp. BG1]|uniref:hypothetical protein n=1 Tax=Galbibacter sp. BG1 TaxID=1170699 RepID=UPI0015C13C24|nr:hypothetical protein [Galbibacter sp. BG1]QLE00054.1 hypothetical protein HX109_00215 [Galbibacter sp. BG1]